MTPKQKVLKQFPDALVDLHCRKCGLEKRVAKDKTDPANTASIKTLCPECAGGDFSLVDYFDKDGKQIMFDRRTEPQSSRLSEEK